MRDGWDAIIVGSGAAGGWAARELAAHDLRVLVLEAGGAAPADAPAPRRGRHPVQSKCYAFDDGTRGLFVDDLDNPYTTPADAPFDWIRARTVGGRMRVWDRVCLRMSERDFSAGWPIAYTELAPYYDEVERAIGVCGRADGIAAVPDGRFVAPPPLGPLAAHLQAALAARGALAQVTPMRRATRAHAATLAAALASPRVALRPNAVVSRILTDPHSGEATGVTYVDRVTRRAADVRARVVMVCASAIESARLLLNSRSARHPDGLGNASGSVGRFLMDHLFLDLQVRCALPEHLAATPGDERGDLYVAAAGPGAGRFGIELAVRAPAATPRHRLRAALGDLLRDQRPLARRWRPRRTCALDLAAIGEVTPHVENRVAVRDDVRDAWGIPVAHIAYRRGAEELAAARAMEAAALATVATGFEIIRARSALYPPGLSVHEMGTVRMGDDPRRSALNRHNQAWDCRTLFVTDAACFPTGGFQNPSLTIMALSLRASRWLARESNLF